MARRNVTLLGATGSIGRSTLDVIRRHPDRFRVHALAAGTRARELAALCREFRPRVAVMADPSAAALLRELLADLPDIRVLAGDDGVCEGAAAPEACTVVAAIVGAAGLRPTLAAVRAGKRVLLANKEALVMSGQLFMDAVAESGAELLPIDSEHNAIFQCLPAGKTRDPEAAGITRILLTASGGPFRGHTAEQLRTVSPAEACAHPNWSMGAKISVDSATLANKGLELAEACWLFARTPDQIEIVVHPQSIVHSMIRYQDGSVLAQLGQPDMRTPIAYGLAWPERIDAGVEPLDIVAAHRLDFEAPDLDAFPCLALAQWAISQPGGMCAFSAANEIAVAAFLQGEIPFTDIDQVIDLTLKQVELSEPASLDAVQALDETAREGAQSHATQLSSAHVNK